MLQNKRREVPYITPPDIRIIMLPKQIFNLCPSRVDHNL